MAIRDLLPATWNKKNVPVRADEEWSNPFYSLQREMNRVFDRFFDDLTPSRLWNDDMSATYLPRIDVKETDKEIRVDAELPGMDGKDIDISVSDNILTLRGEKRMERQEKEDGYFHVERSYGKFHRNIPLPEEVDTAKVEAEFRNGILTVHLPRKPEAQRKSKRIAIKAG